MQLWLAEFDFGDLFKVLGFFLVFILPSIIKAKKEASKKQAAERERDRPRTDVEDRGREAWDALLRGDEPVASVPTPRVATETPRRAPPLVGEVEAQHLDPLARGTLGESAEHEGMSPFEDERSTVLTESKPLTEAEPLTAMPSYADSARSQEGMELSEVSPMGEGEAVQALGVIGANLERATEAAYQIAGPRSSKRRTGVDLRQAVVWSELLAPPVALRQPGDPRTPAYVRV